MLCAKIVAAPTAAEESVFHSGVVLEYFLGPEELLNAQFRELAMWQ
jgi:hypothetical protein